MDVIRAFVAPAEAIEGQPDAIRGVASTVGNVDRAKRAFLPGAFGSQPKRVPLLAFHDATQPIGSSVLTPDGNVLLHESQLANLPEAERFRELIRVGAIPATSIGWVDQGSYQGWAALERANPMLARYAAAAGVVKREDVIYYERAEIVENSLVPIPSNPMALLAVAGMMNEGSTERAILEDLIEMAAGSRHSQSDQAHLQMAHDHLAAVGAICKTGSKSDDEDTTASHRADNLIEALEKISQHPVETADHAKAMAAYAATVLEVARDDHVEIENAATWSTAYVNDLPDTAFAYVEPDCDTKGCRHFPHHDADGEPDEAHVRNALARIPQSNVPDDAKAKALSHIEAHARKLGIEVGGDSQSSALPSLEQLTALELQVATLADR